MSQCVRVFALNFHLRSVPGVWSYLRCAYRRFSLMVEGGFFVGPYCFHVEVLLGYHSSMKSNQTKPNLSRAERERPRATSTRP